MLGRGECDECNLIMIYLQLRSYKKYLIHLSGPLINDEPFILLLQIFLISTELAKLTTMSNVTSTTTTNNIFFLFVHVNEYLILLKNVHVNKY
jgi:hypothetical protein